MVCIPVILHFVPKDIEVSLESFKSQPEGRSEIVMDMFDAIIWRFKQSDDSSHQGTPCRRRCNIFESVFHVSCDAIILASLFSLVCILLVPVAEAKGGKFAVLCV
jgi:hypothetical protein